MRKKERWPMYFAVQEQKSLNLKKSQVARNLGISRNTVIKLWDMSVDEYKKFLESLETRSKKLKSFETEILSWLHTYPDLSAAQVMDWLQERHEGVKIAESTVRSYVRDLRMEYGIPKEKRLRQYAAVEELPMGKQMQVDFGETKLRHPEGYLVRLWFITFVLSRSRHKYARWQDRPFTTADVVRTHEEAFEFYGGLPEEIVYDQDHLLLTSENHGDLILTHEFAKYVEERAFRIHMCRKGDPESKGKIENVVKYIKRNFARHRSFTNVDKLNEQCVAWLHRTGNTKIHQTTKKIPAEVYALEKAYLRPIQKKIESKVNSSITRTVRKDNTIWYQSNRYTVPIGTYDGTDKEVAVQVTDNRLLIYEADTGEILAEHSLCLHRKGELIRNNNHGRDRTKGVQAYIEHVAVRFADSVGARRYLEEIRKRMPRYIRDQLQAIERSVSEANAKVPDQALAYCLKSRLYRATDFADAVKYYMDMAQRQAAEKPNKSSIQLLAQVDPAKLKMKPQIREYETYKRILGGG